MKNMFEDHGEFVSIIVSRKGEHFRTNVDKSDFDRVSSINGSWRLNNKGYISTTKGKKIFTLHRCILSPPHGMLVDHIDGDKLNNRRSNLRLATPQDNVQNIRNHNRNPLSKMKGVKFDSDMNLWRGQITHKRKTIHLGFYEYKEDAGLAYLMAKSLLHEKSIEAGVLNKVKDLTCKYR